MRMRALCTLAIAAVLLAGCAGYQARENLRSGVLVLDLTQHDFLEIWDRPTHTAAVTGDEVIKSGVAGWGGFFFKGREMYEMWTYEARQTRLVFYQRKLVAWKTSWPVESLAEQPAAEVPEVEALTRVVPLATDLLD